MIYTLFHFLFRIAIGVYYRKIYIHELKVVPADTPLIICSNHGNSFMDAIFIAITLKRKIHFLARADVFDSPLKRWFLHRLNMMPVYRIRDGREALQNNEIIFKKCREILDNKGAVLIFPEGNCVVEKRLRTFKSGFADLAISCNVKNLSVLPITINYNNPFKVQDDAALHFNKLIHVDDLKIEFLDFKILKHQLIERTFHSVAENMVIIPAAEDDDVYQTVFEINTTNSDKEFDIKQKLLATFLTNLKTNYYTDFIDLKDLCSDYRSALNKHQLTDSAFKVQSVVKMVFISLISILWLPGWLINMVPFLVVSSILKKVKDIQFISAVKLVSTTFSYIFYLLVLLIILSLSDSGLLIFFLVILSSTLSYFANPSVIFLKQHIKLIIISVYYKEDYLELLNLRNQIKNSANI